MKNVLVVGNAESVWTREYVKHIHCFLGNKVLLTDFYGLKEKDQKFYADLGVGIVDVHGDNGIVRMLKCFRKMGRVSPGKGEKIDILDIQSPPHSIQAKILEKAAKKYGGKTVVTFWGSDILTINQADADRMKGLMDCSDYINIGTNHMQEKLQSFYGNQYDDKCVFIGFGSPAFESIKNVTMSAKECKEYFGLEGDLITVEIGYNGRREQQHIPVIESLSELDEETKGRLQLVIHLGYGGDASYGAEIEEALKKSGIKYRVLTNSYDLDDIAILRRGTDIMLHAQLSDGLSGSIREAVYAGSVLVNPSWLEYTRFDEEGVEYIKYDGFEELPGIIRGIVRDEISVDREKNKKLLYEGYSWEFVRNKWMDVFDE